MKVIRVGPPEPGKPNTISDPDLATFVLGWFRNAVELPQFPLYLDRIEENVVDGVVDSFTFITASGLRYRVRVDFEEDA